MKMYWSNVNLENECIMKIYLIFDYLSKKIQSTIILLQVVLLYYA